MKTRFVFIFFLTCILLFVPASSAQLAPAESRILFQIQKQLEYPNVLKGWNKWTNFCSLPPSTSLLVVCSNNHITELTFVGNKSSPSQITKLTSGNSAVSEHALSEGFSIDSFFTVLTKLSNLKVLTLVSLGLWGPLPAKIDRLWSLEVLNISSNFIYGKIPPSIATLKNLKNLVLSDNLFNGSAQDLKGLQALEVLDLSYNHLGPEFPSLANNNLKTIVLKNNSLRSNIPTGILKLDQLQVLDLSSNKLVGPVPSSLFSLPSIQYLSLAKNQFTGALSPNVSCNGKLNFVDISNNLLIGKLPRCLKWTSRNRRVIDMWNCLSSGTSKYQRQISFCQKQALAVQPFKETEKQQSSTVKLGLVLGIIGGLVGIAVVFGLLIILIFRRAESKKDKKYKTGSFVFEKNFDRGSPIVNGSHVPLTMRLTSLLPPYHVFMLEELEDATNNFDPSNLVGEGSQERLYKGWLRDGSIVLVKCLKLKQRHSPQILQQHMEVISKLRHRHLVSVLGHCIVGYQDPTTVSTLFVVLESVANGSLSEHLTDQRKKEVLKWPQRMAISMGIAKGLQFLHTSVAPGIFGNDLKIDNILLDENLNPKICSYNIALPSKVGSESHLNGQDASVRPRSIIDEKEDIYQLGIILLEVLTGRLVKSVSVGDLNNLKLQLEESLAEAPSKLWEATDPSLKGTYAGDSLKTMVQITINCLCKDSRKRPSIEDVLWHMQYSKQIQEGWTTSSGNLGTKL